MEREHLPTVDALAGIPTATPPPPPPAPAADLPCTVCQQPQPEDTMLLCDSPGCTGDYHCECLDPPLPRPPPPRQPWCCPDHALCQPPAFAAVAVLRSGGLAQK